MKTLTMWGFSTENFNRDPREVAGLMKLFEAKLGEVIARNDAGKYGIRVKFFGDLDRMPSKVRDYLNKAEERTAKNTRYELNILLSYGGRPELVSAFNKIIEEARKGSLHSLDERAFRKFLWTSEIGDPDLVIRTSGEKRLSGAMPWQTVYSELFFCKKLWPDFSKADFRKALAEYAHRKRRYGK